MSKLTDIIENAGYTIRRDGVVLGKDGFRMPRYDAHDPYSAYFDTGDEMSGTYELAMLVAGKYLSAPHNPAAKITAINGLRSDCSVENLKWLD